MRFKGSKNNRNFFFLKEYLPIYINKWVEPFGGSFGLAQLFKEKIGHSIYNDKDLETYKKYKDLADESYNLDWRDILDKFDDGKNFFYFDPPYYSKEFYYKIKFEDHEELCHRIKNLKSNFILSYNNHHYIQHLYQNFNIINIPEPDFYHKNEIIIFK